MEFILKDPSGRRLDLRSERPAELDDLKPRKLFQNLIAPAERGVPKRRKNDKLTTDEVLNSLLYPDYCKVIELNARQMFTLKTDFRYVFVIIRGYVLIWVPSSFKFKEPVFVALRGPEQIIGEMQSLDYRTSDAMIETCDVCELLVIRNEILMNDFAREHPKIYFNIANLLAEKLSVERHRSEVIQTRLTVMKVAQALIYLAEELCGADVFKKPGKISIPGSIPQDRLAAYVGTTRKSVNQALSAFNKKVVYYEPYEPGIAIVNPTELNKIANDPQVAEKYCYKPPPKVGRKK
jgi:CRP-like cAMP-binding protein